jgi:alpha-galactosidase
MRGIRITFNSVYGITTSGNYTLSVTSSSSKRRTVTLHSGDTSVSQTVSSATYTISSIPLQVGQNSLTLSDPASRPVSAQLTYNVEPSYYSAVTGILQGDVKPVNCGGGCLPTGSKVTNMTVGSSVTFGNVSGGVLGGTKLIGIDYINYDVALASALTNGTNTRNFTLSVNGREPRRWSFPISGGDWYETGRLDVLVGGFYVGPVNELRVEAPGLDPGADLVGFAVYT